jgi:hypothetical protein
MKKKLNFIIALVLMMIVNVTIAFADVSYTDVDKLITRAENNLDYENVDLAKTYLKKLEASEYTKQVQDLRARLNKLMADLDLQIIETIDKQLEKATDSKMIVDNYNKLKYLQENIYDNDIREEYAKKLAKIKSFSIVTKDNNYEEILKKYHADYFKIYGLK